MKHKTLLAALLVFGVLVGAGIWYKNALAPGPSSDSAAKSEPQELSQNSMPENSPQESSQKNPIAIFKTAKGNIEIELFMDGTPITAENFIKLAKSGFYDGTKFHRVIKGFMIQGGDPNSKGTDTSKYGFGGSGYTIQDEFVAGLSNVRGTIAMANTGQPNSGGSQFFINLADNTGLDFDKPPFTSSHPVFGKVIKGTDVVDAIAGVRTGASDIPLTPITIESVTIVE
ncbi:MAG: Peptidylprolyl isomerase [Parcubacteria group bacterium GW2011_GWB1_50_9]|uniref:Peptidyl-prolyl cis-trans isomerase n=1 Tax=Candidatus Adlerbacteria bacterium GW2011_GWC1_50_9 TaxID=1618608 RepID=A0A0G1WRI6_9BACT|nr:MAG: Peptidylprolyl isomerase [Parcubacteria group bacterium GW2011_GWB1_50_9]KKW21401.1 MAG: Peptidylprolyl isomerase [Candidatus Adlerbacteria bacterium GW2011_GWC1_50_9]